MSSLLAVLAFKSPFPDLANRYTPALLAALASGSPFADLETVDLLFFTALEEILPLLLDELLLNRLTSPLLHCAGAVDPLALDAVIAAATAIHNDAFIIMLRAG